MSNSSQITNQEDDIVFNILMPRCSKFVDEFFHQKGGIAQSTDVPLNFINQAFTNNQNWLNDSFKDFRKGSHLVAFRDMSSKFINMAYKAISDECINYCYDRLKIDQGFNDILDAYIQQIIEDRINPEDSSLIKFLKNTVVRVVIYRSPNIDLKQGYSETLKHNTWLQDIVQYQVSENFKSAFACARAEAFRSLNGYSECLHCSLAYVADASLYDLLTCEKNQFLFSGLIGFAVIPNSINKNSPDSYISTFNGTECVRSVMLDLNSYDYNIVVYPKKCKSAVDHMLNPVPLKIKGYVPDLKGKLKSL